MGGGFRSVKPISALKRNSVESRWQQHPSDRHGSADTSRQFAIMSVRVRGLVPTFPDGSQAAVAAGLPSKKKMKAARVVGAAAKGTGTIAYTFGIKRVFEAVHAVDRCIRAHLHAHINAHVFPRIHSHKQTRSCTIGGDGEVSGATKQDKAILALSEEYIENLHLQVKRRRCIHVCIRVNDAHDSCPQHSFRSRLRLLFLNQRC